MVRLIGSGPEVSHRNVKMWDSRVLIAQGGMWMTDERNQILERAIVLSMMTLPRRDRGR